MPGPRRQRWQCHGRAQGMAAPLAPPLPPRSGCSPVPFWDESAVFRSIHSPGAVVVPNTSALCVSLRDPCVSWCPAADTRARGHKDIAGAPATVPCFCEERAPCEPGCARGLCSAARGWAGLGSAAGTLGMDGTCPEETSSPSSLPSPGTPHGSAVRTLFWGSV